MHAGRGSHLIPGPMLERECLSAKAVHFQNVFEGQPSQANDHAGRQQIDLRLEVGPAIEYFGGQGLVCGRNATTKGSQIHAVQAQTIVPGNRIGSGCQPGPVQGREQEAPGGISGELAARTIGAMRTRGEADGEDPGAVVAVTRNGLAPVCGFSEGFSSHSADGLAPTHKSGALAAANNLPIQSVKLHQVILL